MEKYGKELATQRVIDDLNKEADDEEYISSGLDQVGLSMWKDELGRLV